MDVALSSMNVTMSDFPSYTAARMKDSYSFTGDNATPISNTADNMGKTSCVDLNRNLEDMYDLDDSSSLSSAKPLTIDNKHGGNGESSIERLIPKVK
ncbi:hypothetical protein L1987_22501 [Smallanthus sonchifolius]|uniref:Uncharacterized protein n=1 Tax=Smallanthus sonchifolius TaxID=185202 RepID=A0ACB9IHP2_9ASTR|nr:hypothetical protein L1987_22501 [Smallanthus sonchifolius]